MLKVIPDYLWDHMKAQADALGGVGGGQYFDDRGDDLCLFQIAGSLSGVDTDELLKSLGLSMLDVDRAVESLNAERGAYIHARVSFLDLMNRLDCVRGEWNHDLQS